MKKKKVTAKVMGTAVSPRNGWVTYMNHFATGEGMTHEIQFCWAMSPQEAIEKHLDRFEYKEDRTYFRDGVIAHDYRSEGAKALFVEFLKDGDHMFNIMQKEVFDFQFKIYWNFN